MKKVLKRNMAMFIGIFIISILLLVLFCPLVKYRSGNDNVSSTIYIRGIDSIMGGRVDVLQIDRGFVNNDGAITHTLERTTRALSIKSNLWLMLISGLLFLFGSSLVFSRFNDIKKTFINESFKLLIICTYSFLIFKSFGSLQDYAYVALIISLLIYAFTYIKEEGIVFSLFACFILGITLFFSGALYNYVNNMNYFVLSKELIVFIILLIGVSLTPGLLEVKSRYFNNKTKENIE